MYIYNIHMYVYEETVLFYSRSQMSNLSWICSVRLLPDISYYG